MALSVRQKRFIQHPGRVKISHGSIRSSKTTAQVLDWLNWLPTAPPGPLAMVGKTRDTVGRNVLAVFEEMHPGVISWRLGAPTCRILGRVHHVLGAADAQAETKIRGLTLAGAMIDEVTLLPHALFVTLLGRLSVHGAYLTGTTNPDSPRHWLKTNYLDRADELGWYVEPFTMVDNPGLAQSWIDQKALEFTGMFYQRFILGKWVSAEGAVYDMWDPARHVVNAGDLEVVRHIAVGVDYGTTNATSAILLGQTRSSQYVLVDEWRYEAKEGRPRLTDQQLSGRLRDWLTKPRMLGGTVARALPPVVVDPSAASLKAQLRQDGMHVADADNEVLYGIRQVSTLLAHPVKPLLVSTDCQGFIGEASGYVWDAAATLKGKDKPLERDDHSMDAARYAVMAALPRAERGTRGMVGIG